MSYILSDFFSGLNELREVVPGIGATVNLLDLNGSAISAKKQICNIITSDVYEVIKVEATGERKSLLAMALANLTMAKQVPFDAVQMRKSNIAVFKNEQEASRRNFMENFYNAMDSLLETMVDLEAWKLTPFALRQKDLQIKSAKDLDSLYPIDGSHFFFFRTISIQEDILDEKMSAYFDLAKDSETETKRLKRSLARFIVAYAMRQFEPLELPATIRNLFDDSTETRYGDVEQTRLLVLADQLEEKAQQTMENVMMVLTTTDTTDSVNTGFQQSPKDKYFFMS